MSSKVYRHRPLAADEYLGRVEPDGKVYESRLGPDRYVGRVETDSGKIYEARLGPDKYVGKVELDTGKVFSHKPMAPDEYLGRVDSDGLFHRHRPMAPDVYFGKIADMPSYAQAGAAFLLLAWPAQEDSAQPAEPSTNETPQGE